MQIDESRLIRQEQGIDKLEANKYDGILYWHTGVGKTFGTQLVIKRLEAIKRHTYLITVTSPQLEKQWKEKLNGYPKHLVERIIVKTDATMLSEDLFYEVDMHIVDEVHKFHTEERLKILNGTLVKSKMFLGLTASADDKNFRPIIRLHKVVDIITEQEAEENGWISKYVEYNLALQLNESEKETYDKFSDTINKLMPKFYKDIGYANNVIRGGKDKNGKYCTGSNWAMAIAYKNGWRTDLNLDLKEFRDIDNLYNPSIIINDARRLTNAVRFRAELLHNATAKYNAVLDLVKKFNKVKTIIFSESTTFADKVGLILNRNNHKTVVFHSKLKTVMRPGKSGKLIKFGLGRLKKEALDAIENNLARIISTAKSLDTGTDIPDLRMSVTASGTQNLTQNKQRKGRATRAEEEKNPVLLVNLYMEDTQDEVWLNNRQSNNINKPIKVNSVDEIEYTPPANYEFTLNDL